MTASIPDKHIIKRILSKSKLTEEDAENIGHKIKHQIAKRIFENKK